VDAGASEGSVTTLALAALIAAAPAGKAKDAKPKDVAADINAPRADARTVRFEATEGTWLSLDVSPDGRSIVFDLLGDLYAVPIEGGAARALTTGPAFDSQPRFSPDGKTIAFASDRGGIDNLWLMDADGGNPRALTQEKDSYVRTPSWSPDGGYVLGRKEDGKRAGLPPVELWMYHREGGGGIKLTSGEELNSASGAAFSPDGRFLYMSVRRQRFDYVPDLSRGLWQVVRFDRTTGETVPVTEGFGGGARPLPSPDGKSLAYVSRRDADTVLVLRTLASGAERVLARGLDRDEQEGFAQADLWPGYAFTPDGASLLLAKRGRIQRLELATGTLREVPFAAQVAQSLAPRVTWQGKAEAGPVEARILRWPSQSPDGKWVAFEAFGRVWLQALADGKPSGAPRRLTADAPGRPSREYAPAFSPDGQWVAYVTWSDRDGGHVEKAAAAPGSVPQRLTRAAGHYANPTWSAQGDRLAVVRGSGLEFRGRLPEEEQLFELHVLDAAGGDTRYVTTIQPPNGQAFHPQAFFSKDGARVLFGEPLELKKPTDDPKTDLVSVRLDGTDKKRLLRVPVSARLAPSPDGDWLAFISRDNVYVAAVPNLATKEPPEVGLKEGAVPVWRLSREAGEFVAWADGGRTLTWGLARAFHRLPLESAVAFAREERRKAAEKEKEKEKAEGDAAGKKDAGKKKAEAEEEQEPKLPEAESFEIALLLPRAAPEGSVVFRGARVVTMKGDEVLERADVVVTGNRIASVGASGSVAVPQDARVVEAAGKTIIPGLIDTHAHLHYSGFEVFPEAKWEYVANLAYGVTTVYDPSAPSLDTFAQAEMVEAGLMEGPRVYSSGMVLYGGQPFDIYAEVGSQADAVRQVKRMKAYGARMIKVYQQPRRAQRLYFAEACRREKMLLTAEGAGELFTDMTMALDGFTAFEHSLPVALRKDAVDLFARSGSVYTPTLIVSYGGAWGELYFWQTRNPHDDPKLNRFTPHRLLDPLGRRHPWITPEEYHFPTVARGAADVVRAGGSVTLGAHGQVQGIGVHWELWMLAGEGAGPDHEALTPHQALRAATLAGAAKIGLAPDLGSVEPGKLADLVVLDADPLQDIHNSAAIRWVVKNGVVYEGETMKQVWPRERERAAFFWEEHGAATGGS
jgi:Tol biopolymer transport system component/imidazolonepropionase-like amidohydrolase